MKWLNKLNYSIWRYSEHITLCFSVFCYFYTNINVGAILVSVKL